MNNNEKNICFIVPYFGKLPNYFQLWLNSCQKNSEIIWKIFINDKSEYRFPKNVHVNYIDLVDFASKIQNLFDFQINIHTPYKLTDFKPVYGQAFSDEIKGFGYWGYCDIDLIFGNIKKILKKPMDEGYDKILTRGHFSLHKNNPEINQLYRNMNEHYKKVFSRKEFFSFDEWSPGGINEIFLKSDKKIYDEIIFSDIYIGSYTLIPRQAMVRENRSESSIFYWDSGELKRIYKNARALITEEILYVHLQKRKLKVSSDCLSSERFVIVPNEFKIAELDGELTNQFQKSFKINRPYFEYYGRRLKNVIKKL
jgi:hypothetical protein